MAAPQARQLRPEQAPKHQRPAKPINMPKPTPKASKAKEPAGDAAAKREKRRGAFLIKLAVLAVGAVLLLSVVERQVQIAEKKEQLSQLKDELAAQSMVNEELRATLSDQQSLEEYAEKRARRDLDYAKPNERVYIDMGGD